MKHITKGREPRELAEWKALENENWQPTYGDLSGQEKLAVKVALMKEQGYLCCYCERRLAGDDSHIEHLNPQSDQSVDPLDYSNLLCSCQNRLDKGEPRHCGNLKGEWFDKTLLVSPLREDCEERIRFAADGSVFPADHNDDGAGETIRRLGLDLPKLTSLRSAAIDPFLSEELTDDEVASFVSGYLRQDQEGKYQPFWVTIKQLFWGVQAIPST